MLTATTLDRFSFLRITPKFTAVWIVHVEQTNRAAPNCRESIDTVAVDREMLVPIVNSRVEQRYKLTINLRRDVHALLIIAPVAGKA